MVLIPRSKNYADMSEAELQVCAAEIGAGGREQIDRAIETDREIHTTPEQAEAWKDLYVQVDDEAASAPASASTDHQGAEVKATEGTQPNQPKVQLAPRPADYAQKRKPQRH